MITTTELPDSSGNHYQQWRDDLDRVTYALSPPVSARSSEDSRGIVICGGGYRYFTNACILLRLLRHLGCRLPVELWAVSPAELDSRMRGMAEELGFEVRFAKLAGKRKGQGTRSLPPESRWQWLLKPYAVLHSRFQQVLSIDADSFPTRDPSHLFDSPFYREHGAVFWPDARVTDKNNAIWDVVGIPYRHEPEFETGQMLIDKRRCWEPLQLALWMNEHADRFYHLVWGDKDTFRFAWHKFGRPFGMVSHPPQPMFFPGNGGVAGLWQHDFDGNWLFQHRNMAKWDLLAANPRIPGYLHETESRRFLAELRRQWNGRVTTPKRQRADLNRAGEARRASLIKDLMSGTWLFEDRRPKAGCCGPALEWSDQHFPHPWKLVAPDAPPPTPKATRYTELTFLADSIGTGAQKDLCWWELQPGKTSAAWTLHLIGEDGVTVSLRLQPDGSWSGSWRQRNGEAALNARLLRPALAYPEKLLRRGRRNSKPRQDTPVHIAHHAYGIGDAVHGLYVINGIVDSGTPVIFHTRFPQWLKRVEVKGLTITDEPPPPGACDLDAFYGDQLRYGASRTGWYAMQAAATGLPHVLPLRPRIDHALADRVLDMDRYVLLAPASAWQTRDWTQTHWRRLAHLLVEAGYEVVAIGSKQDEGRLQETFDKSNAYWVVDQTPEWVMSAMLGAECVIGLDSGMIHLAGLLSVPAICIHSQLPPKFLFSCAPSVVSVTSRTECTFCCWQVDRGFNEGCATACSALATVSPEEVMTKLGDPKLKRTRGRLDRIIERDNKRSRRAVTHVKIIEPDVIAYTHGPETGVGEAALMNIAALKAAGLTVEQRPWERTSIGRPSSDGSGPIYYHHWHPQPDEGHRDWTQAGFRRGRGTIHLGYWAYEVEGALPAHFRNLAPFMTEIWTPSRFCERIFSKAGKPVHVLPHAVPALDSLRDLPSKEGKAPYTVLYIFDAWSSMARKNPQAAVRVFQAAFPHRHDVRLVLKGNHLSALELAELQAAWRHDSRISVIDRFLSVEELDQVFDHADVLLSLQRGEGFGLNIARALGRGLPVITTGWGGQMDFCTPENSLLVPCQLRSVTEQTGHPFDSGEWAEPDEQAAVGLLQELAAESAAGDAGLHQRREHGRLLIANEFSQAALNRRVLERVEALRATILNA